MCQSITKLYSLMWEPPILVTSFLSLFWSIRFIYVMILSHNFLRQKMSEKTWIEGRDHLLLDFFYGWHFNIRLMPWAQNSVLKIKWDAFVNAIITPTFSREIVFLGMESLEFLGWSVFCLVFRNLKFLFQIKTTRSAHKIDS